MTSAGRFDWHGDPIAPDTPVTENYRNTQNVRRFLRAQWVAAFKFDRSFMQLIKHGTRKTMGEVAEEWLRRQAALVPDAVRGDRRAPGERDAPSHQITFRSPNVPR